MQNNYVAIIPARKNSKRIKNKNIQKIKNKILFNYTLEAAKKISKISKIVVTTDIKSLMKKNTKKIIYIKRPKSLCLDESSTESAIFHSLDYLKYRKKFIPKNIILLQPTSPFRTSLDIKNAIRFYETSKFDSLFSAYQDKMFVWFKKNKKYLPMNYNVKKRIRGQKIKKLVIENGAIFIFNYKKFIKKRVRLFGKIGCFLMNKRNSLEIDNKYDLFLANKI